MIMFGVMHLSRGVLGCTCQLPHLSLVLFFIPGIDDKQKRFFILTISVRQAVITARRSVMLAYGRPVYRQSQRQVLKSF